MIIDVNNRVSDIGTLAVLAATLVVALMGLLLA